MYRRELDGSTLSIISGTISEKNVPEKRPTGEAEAASFEEAISATKFGKFNLILILIAIPSGWSSIFETTTMSYVFPAAQCDLSLNLENKGLLNAVTYTGMMSSGLIWGYLCDTLGRKKLLYIGYFLDSLFIALGSASQSFTVLVISKFLGGFLINGPFAALTAYLSEFHCAKYRARVQMVLGIIYSVATILLPLLAQFILPVEINFTIFDSLKIHSWNIYLLVTAIPSFMAGCGFIFLPESPKFLMTIGRNDKALEVFQTVYSLNTGKPRDTYPITKLVDEKNMNTTELCDNILDEGENKTHAFLQGWNSVRPLFFPPLVKNLLLSCGLQAAILLSLNTLRLWIPQLFQGINDYEFYNNGTTADLCTMLDVIRPNNITALEECVVNTNNSQVYINSIIIASVSVCAYLVAGWLINFLGKKRLLFKNRLVNFLDKNKILPNISIIRAMDGLGKCLVVFLNLARAFDTVPHTELLSKMYDYGIRVFLGAIGGLTAYAFYFSASTELILVLSSIYISMGSIAMNVVLTVVVDLFPTTLRTMALQVVMIFGRLGAMCGNLLFPFLLKTGCAAPFFTLGTVLLGSACISLFLPNTDLKPLD